MSVNKLRISASVTISVLSSAGDRLEAERQVERLILVGDRVHDDGADAERVGRMGKPQRAVAKSPQPRPLPCCEWLRRR
jgi:hypothetical protein